MGIAALILGIVSLIIGFIPFCGIIALVPAIIGIILGIVDIRKKKKTQEKKGSAIAGLVCASIATVVIILWYVVSIGITMSVNSGLFERAKDASTKFESSYTDVYDM